MSETPWLVTQLAEARAMVERGELRLWAKTQEVTELEVERDEARANAERLRITLDEQDHELDTAREDVLRLTAERDESARRCETLRELADQSAHESGVAFRRLAQAQERGRETERLKADIARLTTERDAARAEVRRLLREERNEARATGGAA